MPIQWRKSTGTLTFLDPTRNWEPTARVTEIRHDPLTGLRARILDYPAHFPPPPDFRPAAEESAGWCPFCPERVTTVTPRFLAAVTGEGRLVRGPAILFPNLFPYDENSAVGVFSGDHYMPLNAITAGWVQPGLELAQDYARVLAQAYPGRTRHFTFNWNFLPTAGASLVHPHFQIIAGEEPTNRHADLLEASRGYYREHGRVFWEELAEEERAAGERWLGETGPVAWVAAFAPQGLLEVWGITDSGRYEELSAAALGGLADGISRLASAFAEEGYSGFNLTIFSGVTEEDRRSFRVQLRMVPRLLLSAAGTSDMNYFHTLHGEAITMLRPEEVAARLRPRFSPAPAEGGPA
ncbi:MAG: hypothetical protein OWV35_02225 [Firmicutes bacterium]|nr:hypothetical protein [Bacillota bacterium]